jgi:hypothetical protein
MDLISRFVFLITLALNSSAALGAQPRVVLIEHDPWLMVVGSDSPTFVLYSNGFAIFRARAASSSPSSYLSAQLTTAQHQKLLSEIAPESLLDFEDWYDASLSTDQPMNKLHVWVNGNRKSITVYGALRRDSEARSKTPSKFLRAFDALINFSADASPWVPDRIEVLIWPYDYSPERPLPWPKGWPPFEEARPRGARGLHQLFLPAEQFGRLREFVSSVKPKQAVLLGGRKWAIDYRLPFPEEKAWAQ